MSVVSFGIEDHTGISILICIIIAVFVIIYLKISNSYRRKAVGPRAALIIPYKLPFGLDLAFEMLVGVYTNTLMDVQSRFLKYGHVVEVNAAGSTMIFTDEPEIFKATMSSKFSDFGKGKILHDVFTGSMADAVFCTDGDVWRRERRLLRPHTAKIRGTDLELTEEHFAHVLKIISNGGKPVEVWDLADRYQLDVATRIFFGYSADSLVSNRQPFRHAMERLLRLASLKMTFGAVGNLMPEWLIAPSALRELDRYVKSLYDLAHSSGFEKKAESDLTMLEGLAAKGLKFKEFKAQVTAVMLGGKDPPALTITWAIWELARNPEIYKKMREEIASVCGFSTPPTAAQLKECQFVEHVANEAMRLYHPLSINMKIALRDTTLPIGGGKSGREPLGVLKGTQVVLSLWNLQRRPDLVGLDANVFNPSRWETWIPQKWEFIPFNHGVRTCIGQKFGMEQVKYILARIAQEFESLRQPVEQKEMQYKFELNVKPLHGCLVCFEKKGEGDS